MYLTAVKFSRVLLWAAVCAGFLAFLWPRVVPLWLAVSLAGGCAVCWFYVFNHLRTTRRHEYRCPVCGWVPFVIRAWKCKQCGQVWDSFETAGACPRCGHEHEETACLRCKRISPNRDWRSAAV